MDFVKREDQSAVEENYKMYMDNFQKHQLESEYHTQISMEQLHQAMQSSLNNSGIVHNFQLPLSPRQMSTLMLKTNHISRSLNFNETHGQREDEIHQNLRHEENLRNLDVSLFRNEMELQSNLSQALVQNLSEHDLRNLDLSRLNELHLRNDIPLNQDLSHRHLEQELLHLESRRIPIQDNLIIDQNLTQRLTQNIERLDQSIAQRLGQTIDQNLAQRLGQSIERLDQNIAHRLGQNLDQRLVQTVDQRLVGQDLGAEHVQMPFHIKSEQEDDGYFYENPSQSMEGVGALNGQLPQETQQTPQLPTNDQLYQTYNQVALNSVDLYSRPQNYMTYFKDNPQNLVVRQFELPYADRQNGVKKQDGDDTAKEEPKENMKPSDENKLYFDYQMDKPENVKLNEDLSFNIKGEYVCYKCSEIFPSKRGLKQHSKSCLDDSEKEKGGKFGCTQCSYRCQSPAILKIHERVHSGEKPFSCTFCDYKSGQKNNVAKHILVHMKEKPFRCQFCSYKCAQKNNLVVHERTHTGFKPFACSYCSYRTVQKPNLVKHMYLHTNQKPFSCDQCNYRCVQKTNLTKHKLRHLNDRSDKVDIRTVKPYRPRQKSVKCNLCPYRCVQKSSMEKHMEFRHNTTYQDQENICDDVIQNLSVKKDEFYDKDDVMPSDGQL